MTHFFNKLMRLKKYLRLWNKDKFGKVSVRVKQAEENLLKTEQEYDRKRNEKSRTTLNEARAEHTKELSRKCELCR